jgi:hypothetical protein
MGPLKDPGPARAAPGGVAAGSDPIRTKQDDDPDFALNVSAVLWQLFNE